MQLTSEIERIIRLIGGNKAPIPLHCKDLADLQSKVPLRDERVDELLAALCQEYTHARLNNEDVESKSLSISDDIIAASLYSFLWRQQGLQSVTAPETVSQSRRRIQVGNLIVSLLRATETNNHTAYRPEIVFATSALRSIKWMVDAANWLRVDREEFSELLGESCDPYQWYWSFVGLFVPSERLPQWNIGFSNDWTSRPVNRSILCRFLFPLNHSEVGLVYETVRTKLCEVTGMTRGPSKLMSSHGDAAKRDWREELREVVRSLVNCYAERKSGTIFEILNAHDDLGFDDNPFRSFANEVQAAVGQDALPIVKRNLQIWIDCTGIRMDEQKQLEVCQCTIDTLVAIKNHVPFAVPERVA